MTNNTIPFDATIKILASWIQEANHLVFFGGAGVSTESGIPDFRSADGLYLKNQYGYPAEYLLSHSCFMQHPERFFEYYRKEMIHEQASPNDAHAVLAKWEELGLLKTVITQNIDGLHQKAGSRSVIELHGSIHRNTCQRCFNPHPLSAIGAVSSTIPTCKCGGIIKPDVILYEEALREDVVHQAIEAIARADVLLIGGTSLRVYPAAGMLRYFKGKRLVLLNKDETPYDDQASLVLREPIAQVMHQIHEIIMQTHT